MDRGMLARATEGTDAPTPGYLYIDLTKAASSNPMACQEIARYLTNRLQSKQNPNIKTKCCKVIAKLADGVPRNQFRRAVAQDASAVGAIKEAMNYRGPMDPVRGDEPNARVRQAAKEALDAVYREAPTAETSAVPTSSYGPSPHDMGGYSGSSSAVYPGGRRMEGVGNPMFSDPRHDPRYNGAQPSSFKEAVREAGDVLVGMIKDPLARNIPTAPQVHHAPRQGHSGDLPGYNRSQVYGRPPPGASELSRQTGGQWTMASNRGPGAINTEASEYSRSANSGAVGGSWGNASVQHSTPSITINHDNSSSTYTMSATAQAAVSDGSYETNLILELCPPGGLKPVPPPEKLADFSRNLPSLNADLICPAVLDCLEEGQPWIIRAKALCVMEACIQHGTLLTTGQNPYRDFFHACHEEIIPLSQHPRAAIHDPARRVLRLLGLQTEATSVTPVSPPPIGSVLVNLLDFDQGPEPAAPPASAPPAANLFGGMQVKAPATASVAAPPVSEATDLLGGYENSALAPASESTAPSLLDGFGTSASAPAAVTTTSSMFAQMNLKDNNGSKPSAVVSSITGIDDLLGSGVNDTTGTVTSATGVGSAFSFINKENTASDLLTKEEIISPANPGVDHTNTVGTIPTFDPLQNVTPQTAQRKMMMSLSAEQMQAMAYQQTMWMQQQQQMQMALMMQQQRGALPPGMILPFPGMAPPVMKSGATADARPVQKDDKKFDFVLDAMKTAGSGPKK